MKEKASEMKLPGFTAEASVYKRSSDYFGTGSADSQSGTVAPASIDACYQFGAECLLGMGLACVLALACTAGAEP